MAYSLRPDRKLAFAAWAIVLVFAGGLLVRGIGIWTFPILGAWFIGTQRPLGGLVWLFAITLALSVVAGWSGWMQAPVGVWPQRLLSLVWVLMPFFLYRLLQPRRFPLLAGLVLPFLDQIARLASKPWGALPATLAPLVAGTSAPFDGFGADGAWFPMAAAGAVTALWIHEVRWHNWRLALMAFSGLAVGVFLLTVASAAVKSMAWVTGWPELGLMLAWFGLPAAFVAAWTFIIARREQNLDPSAFFALRSPGGREHLRLIGGRLTLPSGASFPVHNGIPRFASPAALGGMNAQLNSLYAHIAGLYDDIQRIYLSLRGLRRDAYMSAYLTPLEIKTGDRVLETSIGTGANFRLLPKDIHRFGLDLSAAMLNVCRDNFERWGYTAELVQGNAEMLPYADESFDAVFHVGGINFFNDRASAIAEMIRVAKPGSLILIADETEKHVREVYEAIPGEREYFKGRSARVSAPLDLVPENMLDTSMKTLRGDSFYVLTFRKPY